MGVKIMSKPKHAPLSVTVTREGKLRIEIGIETLAHATLHGNHGVAEVVSARKLARAVATALEEADEAGDTPVTRMLDAAIETALFEGDVDVEFQRGTEGL